MTQHPDAKVFIVDDDAGVRDALAWLLRTRRLLSERYDSADAFLAEITRWSSEPAVPCCLLLDVRMPGTSGLALFEQLLALSAQVQEGRRAQHSVQQRLDSLTERERDVMDLVIEGLPNKLVADRLNISVRTVEVHRSRVFDKMGVKSAVELANALRQLGAR